MHKAILYQTLEGKKVKCTACKQYCTIAEGHTGICGVRQNIGGKLFLLVYWKASAVNIDPVEKKPLYHFMPGTKIFSIGTVGCNFGCEYCQNWELSQATKGLKEKLSKDKRIEQMGLEVGKLGYELEPKKIIEICKSREINSIAYTYNEPIIFFEYLYDTSRIANKNGIKNVMVSNGYESDESLKMLAPYISAINIDLKSFSEEFYSKVCKALLGKVLETIKYAHKLGIWIEITTLVIPGKNDSENELKNIAEFIAGIDKRIPWHVTAFHPDYKMNDIPATSHAALAKARIIGKNAGLDFVYIGNIFDDESSNTYCPKCKNVLIKRRGYLVSSEKFNNGKCQNCNIDIPGVWK